MLTLNLLDRLLDHDAWTTTRVLKRDSAVV
jgi:hypothetical protein